MRGADGCPTPAVAHPNPDAADHRGPRYVERMFPIAAALAQDPVPVVSAWAPPAGLDLQSPLAHCHRAKGETREDAVRHAAAELAASGRDPAAAARLCATAKRSDLLLMGSFAVGLGSAAAWTLLTDPTSHSRWEPGAGYLVGFTTNFLLMDVVKRNARRPRPFTQSPAFSGVDCLAATPRGLPDACQSFFSGHTSNTAFNLFYAASAYDLYGPATQKPGASALAYAFATVGTVAVGTARVSAGWHYWSDVAVGALVGTGVGLLTPRAAQLIPETERPVPVLGVNGAW